MLFFSAYSSSSALSSNSASLLEKGLIHLCASGHTLAAQLLIRAGCNPNCEKIEEIDLSPFMPFTYSELPIIVAANKPHIDTIKMLLENGVDINSENKLGHTVLHKAAMKGHLELIKFLLEKGANVNGGSSSESVLECAIKTGSLLCVKLLVDSGADTANIDQDLGSCNIVVETAEKGNLELFYYLCSLSKNPYYFFTTISDVLNYAAYDETEKANFRKALKLFDIKIILNELFLIQNGKRSNNLKELQLIAIDAAYDLVKKMANSTGNKDLRFGLNIKSKSNTEIILPDDITEHIFLMSLLGDDFERLSKVIIYNDGQRDYTFEDMIYKLHNDIKTKLIKQI